MCPNTNRQVVKEYNRGKRDHRGANKEQSFGENNAINSI